MGNNKGLDGHRVPYIGSVQCVILNEQTAGMELLPQPLRAAGRGAGDKLGWWLEARSFNLLICDGLLTTLDNNGTIGDEIPVNRNSSVLLNC